MMTCDVLTCNLLAAERPPPRDAKGTVRSGTTAHGAGGNHPVPRLHWVTFDFVLSC